MRSFRIPTRARAPLGAAAAALAVRAAVLLELHGTPFTRVMVGDATTYRDQAARIAAGEAGSLGVFFQSPLYPFLLAALDAAGDGGWVRVALAQAALGSLACAAVAGLAARAFPTRPAAAWLAGVGAALYGPLVFHDLEVLPTGPAASLLAIGLAVLGRSPGRAAAAGVLLGAAALLAPGLALVAPAAALWAAAPGRRARREALLPAALLLAGATAAILPAALHNRLAGDTVLIASSAGVNAYIGNNPEANGAFVLPPSSGLDGSRLEASAREAAERAAGRSPLLPSEVSSHWLGRALEFVRGEPVAWARLVARKVLLLVNHAEIPNHLNFDFVARRFAPLLRVTLPFWAIFPLAALGAALAVSRSEGRLVVLASAAALAPPLLFFVTGRYRVPAAPALLALAGGGVAWLADQAASRRWRQAAAGALAAAGLLAVTRLPLARQGDFAFDHILLGTAYRRLGNLHGAVVEFKLAEETGRPGTDAAFRLAQVLVQRGNLAAAGDPLRRHLSRHPGDAEAAAALSALGPAPPAGDLPVPTTDNEAGVRRLEEGDLEGAAAAFQRAIHRDPAHGRAWINLAAVRDRQGRGAEAVRAAERAAALEPGSPTILRSLAILYLRLGRLSDARATAERARALNPGDPETRRVLDRVAAGG